MFGYNPSSSHPIHLLFRSVFLFQRGISCTSSLFLSFSLSLFLLSLISLHCFIFTLRFKSLKDGAPIRNFRWLISCVIYKAFNEMSVCCACLCKRCGKLVWVLEMSSYSLEPGGKAGKSINGARHSQYMI